MRQHLVDRLALDVEPDSPQDVARDMMVDAFGPRTAAWLVRRLKGRLQAKGAVDLVLPHPISPVKAEELRWFFIAMEALRRRRGWSVDVQTQRGRRVFRLRWLGWMKNARAMRTR